MNKLVTLASVGVFLLSLQGASLAQDKTPTGPATPPVASPSVTGPVETPATPETTGVQKPKKTKKSQSTKKAKKAKAAKKAKKAKKAPKPKAEE